METSNTFPHRDSELLAHDRLRRVLGQLQVVDAGHHARQVVVGGQRRLVRLADDGEGRVQSAEA